MPDNGHVQQPEALVQFQFVLLSTGQLQLNYAGSQAHVGPVVMSALMEAGKAYLKKEQERGKQKLVLPSAGMANRIKGA